MIRFALVSIFSLLVSAVSLAADPTPNPRVEIKTSQGTMIVELYAEQAPKSVANFLHYTKDGFYAGTVFHRVIDNFMIQGGGFTEKMLQKETRATIVNEATNGLKNELGTLAMARTSEPHSASSQFFINLKHNEFLNNPGRDGWGYAVFGKVVDGMDVVQKIAKVQTGNSGMYQNVPTSPVTIISVKLLTEKK